MCGYVIFLIGFIGFNLWSLIRWFDVSDLEYLKFFVGYLRFLMPLGLIFFIVATWTAKPSSLLRTLLSLRQGRLLLLGAFLLGLPRLIVVEPGDLGSLLSDALWSLFGISVAMVGYRLTRYRTLGQRGVPWGRITEKAEDAFNHIKGTEDDPKRVTAEKYLDFLRDNIKATEETFRKTLLLLFGLIVAFVLIELGVVRSVGRYGLELKDYSLIRGLIPLAVSYVYFELMSLIVLGAFSRQTYTGMLERANQKIVEHNLYDYMLPSSSWSMVRTLTQDKGSLGAVTWLLTILTVGTSALAPPFFTIIAFYRILEDFPCSGLAWLALGVSSSYLALGVLILAQLFRSLWQDQRMQNTL
jgi:hypothetical protein